jgi:hypothetical protein
MMQWDDEEASEAETINIMKQYKLVKSLLSYIIFLVK